MGLNGKAKIKINRTMGYIEGDYPGSDLDKMYSFTNPPLARLLNKQTAEMEGEHSVREKATYTTGIAMAMKLRKRSSSQNHMKTTVHMFDLRTATFPSGLVEDIVPYLKEEDISVDVEDVSEKPKREFNLTLKPKYKGKDLVLRDYQKEALDAADSNRMGLYSMATNSGKSLLASSLIANKGVRTLVLVQRQEMLNQWIEFLESYLGVKAGKVRGGSTIIKPVTVAIVDSASKNIGLMKEYGFEMVIVDECHHAASATHFSVIRHIDPYYVYGLTGTAFRSRKVEETALTAAFGPILSKIDNSMMQDLGYSVPVEVDVRILESIQTSDLMNWSTIYHDLICTSDKRNRAVLEVIREYYEDGNSILIPLNQISHCEALAELLDETDMEYRMGHAKMSDAQREEALESFKSGRVRILLGTLYNEAVDIPIISAIINAAGLKSAVQTFQRLGRGLRTGGRDKCYYIDFMDMGNHYLEQHAFKRMKNIEKAGCTLPSHIIELFEARERDMKEKLKLTDEEKEQIQKERECIANSLEKEEDEDV